MGRYVDGYVIPIKKNKIKSYKKMALFGRKLWMDYGALDYYECVGDDLKTKWGWTFPKMCKLKNGETVIFSFIVFRSKAHRNRVNANVMKDPRMKIEKFEMPFDMKRFAMGGFRVLVRS